MMRRIHDLVVFLAVVGLVAVGTGHAAAQKQIPPHPAFQPAVQARDAAQKFNAAVLAPKSFQKAAQLLENAVRLHTKGSKSTKVQRELAEAVAHFEKALAHAKTAEPVFTETLKARSDAMTVDAPRFSDNLWARAEEKFIDGARKLESGSPAYAQKRAMEAEKIYRDAELAAIKANYLAETWRLLRTAEKMKVSRYAPKTLSRAQSLIQQAETELNENRYDTDKARNLAQQAKYEARHAIYLTRVLIRLEEEEISTEDILLASEEPLAQIAGALDFVPAFDNGYTQVTDRIVEAVRTYQEKNSKLDRELSFHISEVVGLKARVNELESQLGGLAREKTMLSERVLAQAKLRRQFYALESMFTSQEASVIRQGADIIIRMRGLNFASGQAIIEPKYFQLLSKVQKAISTFPGCHVIIEGHTDSFGGDRVNRELSKARATAVRQYLQANLNLDDSRIQAIGHGEHKPIANNETPAGRRANRRIDIVIQPGI